jgi:hypothetical protein
LTAARGPATPRRARACGQGPHLGEARAGRGPRPGHGRPANRAEPLRRRRGRARTGRGLGAAPPGQGCGGTRCYLSNP